MSRDQRKVAAAFAAVREYLAEEERGQDAAQAVTEAAPACPSGAGPGPAVSLWAVQGRMGIMQMRHLMQWRALRKL